MVSIETIQERLSSAHSLARAALSLDQLQEWANDLGSTIHVAVMVEPYLSKICSGEKYIESRLTKVNIPPFERASPGDIILFKRSGGAITAMASVERVEFELLTTSGDARSLAERYSDGLRYEPGYVELKRKARFASLLWLREVRQVAATFLEKRDRQAWVTVRPSNEAEFATPELAGFLF